MKKEHTQTKARKDAAAKGLVRLPERYVWPSHKALILAYIDRLIARGEKCNTLIKAVRPTDLTFRPKAICANCYSELDLSNKESFKTCMHKQMHRYVCNDKCMVEFYAHL